jgi:hypothetical protein
VTSARQTERPFSLKMRVTSDKRPNLSSPLSSSFIPYFKYQIQVNTVSIKNRWKKTSEKHSSHVQYSLRSKIYSRLKFRHNLVSGRSSFTK